LHAAKRKALKQVRSAETLEVGGYYGWGHVHQAGLVRGTAANSAVRVGLLGCAGRGTEDATNLIDTGNARVVALADMFQDQLDAARAHFNQVQRAKDYTDIDASQLFHGPNAYQQIAHSKEENFRGEHYQRQVSQSSRQGC
jgi:hypothetical protein